MSETKVMPPNWVTICDSLRDEPETWKSDKYNLTHDSGVSLWIANGWMHLRANDSVTDVHFGLVGRWKAWQAYKTWKRWQLPMVMTTKVTVESSPL